MKIVEIAHSIIVYKCPYCSKHFSGDQYEHCPFCKEGILYANQKPEQEAKEIADMIETYFKKWNGKGFDKPTPLERQSFEACAEAISALKQGREQGEPEITEDDILEEANELAHKMGYINKERQEKTERMNKIKITFKTNIPGTPDSVEANNYMDAQYEMEKLFRKLGEFYNTEIIVSDIKIILNPK